MMMMLLLLMMMMVMMITMIVVLNDTATAVENTKLMADELRRMQRQ